MTAMRGTLEERFWAKVDKRGDDECWLWLATKGGRDYKEGNGYGYIDHLGKNKRAHRVSYEMHIGEIPPGLQIDHKCHHRSCVNPSHLRLATQSQNSMNRIHSNPNRMKGTRLDKRKGKWYSYISLNNKKIFLGYFHTEQDAHAAYCVASIELHGEFSNLGHEMVTP